MKFKNLKITKMPLVRNFIVFLLSIFLVMGAKTLNFSEAAGEAINKYEQVLRGEDFETECERDEDEAESIPVSDDEKDTDEIGDVVEKYHDVLNCMFNTRIKDVMILLRMEEIEETEDFEIGEEEYRKLSDEDLDKIYKLLSPPLPLAAKGSVPPGARAPCKPVDGTPPLSTYCLAQRGVEEFFEFRAAMQMAREMAQLKVTEERESVKGTEGEFPLHMGFSDVAEIAESLAKQSSTADRIDQEIEIAKQTLDTSLAAYNEMLFALPLHRKYKEVIMALEEYRSSVEDIRKQVDLYPDTFLDVTTTACT